MSYVNEYTTPHIGVLTSVRHIMLSKGVISLYEEFTQDRIATLRIQKGVTARDMSLSLGQNDSYINRIENKHTLPSLQVLFYICEYLKITPKEFFDEDMEYPVELNALIEDLKQLDANALASVSSVVKEILRKK